METESFFELYRQRQIYYDNYMKLYSVLNKKYRYIDGLRFYHFLFPSNEFKGDFNTDYSRPNAIFLYKDHPVNLIGITDLKKRDKLHRRIMLQDTWLEDFKKYVDLSPLALCSGLSYRGRVNRLENAQKAHALIFDLDNVGINELENLLLRIGKKVSTRTLPQPTFIVISGTGLHIYYVFDEPIDLYPNIKLQLKALKYDLTFRIWDYKSTTQEKQIQYQSINQAYRMVGSDNSKYGLEVVAFKTGERVTIDYLNEYVIDEKNKVDLTKLFAPSKYTLEEAKENFPDWYQRVVIDKNKNANKWHIKRNLYDWWIRQIDLVKGGHRYYFLMCMSIYAVKCDIPKDELRKDMIRIFDQLKEVEHSNQLTKEDIHSALEIYDRSFYNFTINDIVKLTDIPILKNKRNYRKQETHLKLARNQLALLKELGEVNVGRPLGSGTKEELVKKYRKKHPNAGPTEIARALGISRTTVYKYMKEVPDHGKNN